MFFSKYYDKGQTLQLENTAMNEMLRRES